ncbi:monovalent cation/H+ antiporter subunit D family protein [Methanonatronarchaeum sp. AMET-Sl]|uniref:complex I subunit 5 family protein n=1 Tax=Methanonatronarchaeum sp. AMET-Sl TaxID=3037654 RepID=UPI00244E0DDD|nr:monovalent cation/H+ antiporter subunit D family protein [Methanonatronarchaeum sp. AMET-Sl]WGI17497.1 monovalent cation/H+ antiporter subunit D family protein [Methanonatronarchaeum sp. AMET-Sl]
MLIILLPLLGAYIIPIIGYFKPKITNILTTIIVLITTILAVLLAIEILVNGEIYYFTVGEEPPWGVEILADHLAALMALIVLGVTLLATIFSKKYVKHSLKPKKEVLYYTLILLMTGGLLWFIMAADAFNMFVGLEIFSIASYSLTAISQDKKAITAAFNYLLMGAVGSAFFLLGIGYLYIMTGTLNFADLAARIVELDLYPSTAIFASLAFIVTGLSIKSALFPLHVWLPDAHSKALSPVSALFSAVLVEVAAYGLIRILLTVYGYEYITEVIPLTTVFLILAGIAVLFGSLLAIYQTDIKRMLAYSSVSQMGYIIFGFGLGTSLGLSAGLLHLFNHALMKSALFLAAGAVIYLTGKRNIYDYGGLGQKMPYTMAFFGIAALAMIGIPPTNGFISKFYLAWAAVDIGQWVFVIVILLSSLLNAIYFFRVLNIAYTRENDDMTKVKEPLTIVIPIGILAISCIIFGFGFSIPLDLIEPFAESLMK